MEQRARRANSVTSLDGTRIAYEIIGTGSPVLFIGGILSDRSSLAELAHDVASATTAVIFDRRGRGESGSASEYAVMREVEDIQALANAFPEKPFLFGHSSGAGLAIEAAASGMPLAGMILYEPPYGPDDAVSRAESVAFAESIQGKLSEGDRSGAIAAFFEAMGMAGQELEAMAADPILNMLAPTMAHDFAVMGQIEREGVIPISLLEHIDFPTLVLTGEQSPPFFTEIAAVVAESLPNGRMTMVPQADHSARSSHLAPIILDFLGEQGVAR